MILKDAECMLEKSASLDVRQPRSQGLSSLPPLSLRNDNGGREERPWERGCNNLIFSAQIIGLNPVFKYEKKHIVLLKLTVKFVL